MLRLHCSQRQEPTHALARHAAVDCVCRERSSAQAVVLSRDSWVTCERLSMQAPEVQLREATNTRDCHICLRTQVGRATVSWDEVGGTIRAPMMRVQWSSTMLTERRQTCVRLTARHGHTIASAVHDVDRETADVCAAHGSARSYHRLGSIRPS